MRRVLIPIGLNIFACGAVAAADSPPAGVHRHPIPEYAPVAAMILAEDLFKYNYHAGELVDAINASGAAVWVATPGHADQKAVRSLVAKSGAAAAKVEALELPHDNIWLRDFGPIPVADGLADSETLRFVDARYDDGSPLSDKLPSAAGKTLRVPVEPLPVFLDGGNLLVAGDICVTTEPVGGGPAKELQPGPQALRDQHKDALGCSEVLVLENPPHAHIDMWAKAVDDKTLLVNELTDKTLSIARKSGNLADARALKSSLDKMASELARHFKVVRLPMPLPYRGVFRTYANSILVNGHAIVPSFKRFGWNYDDYPDQTLTGYYEGEAIKAYKSVGLSPRLINADGMIFNGGAFHCVTVTLPKPFAYPSPLKGS